MKNILDYIKVFKNIETYKGPGSRNMADGGRIGYENGQLVRNTADGSRPGYQGRYITSDKYTGVFTEAAGPRSPKRIRFEITYMDNEGKKIKVRSKPNYSSQAKAYEGKLKKIAEIEKDLGIGKGDLFDQEITQKRVQKSYLPKNKKNYIHVNELAELLGVSRLDPVGRSVKNVTSASKVASKLLDQTTIKTSGGVNVDFYKPPTDTEIATLKKYTGKYEIYPYMKDRIKLIQNDKYTAQVLKDGKLPIIKGELDPKFYKHINKRYGSLGKYIHGLVRYTQGLDGQMIVGLNDEYLSDGKFKSDKKLADKIRNTLIETPAGTSNGLKRKIRSLVYQSAMSDLSSELGNETVSFKTFQDKIRRQINDVYKLKGKGFEIDELIGVSSSFRNRTAPYSVFTQITTKELNQGILKDYQKVLSNHTADLKTEINKNSKFVDGKWFHSAKAKKIVNNFNKVVLPNLKNIDQLKGTGFSLPEMTLGAPTDRTLGGTKGRLATLEKAGLGFKEFYQAEGFGYKMPKNVLTQKELFTQLSNTDNVKKFKKTFSKTMQTDLSPRSVAQLAKIHGCKTFQEGGSIMSCLQTKFNKAPEKFLQKSAPLAKDNINLFKWFKNGRKIARGTGIALAWEAAFAPIIVGWGALEGQSGQRILNDIAYGIPFIGETTKEEFMREAGGDELAYKMKQMGELENQELPYLYQQLEQVQKQSEPTRAKMPKYISPKERYILDDIKEKKLKLQALYNTPEFYEGPAGGQSAGGDYGYNEPVIQDAYALEQLTTKKIAADMAARKKATFDSLKKAGIIADRNWQSQVSYAGGGMVGDKSGPPPESGPMSQGLRSLYINDKDY